MTEVNAASESELKDFENALTLESLSKAKKFEEGLIEQSKLYAKCLVEKQKNSDSRHPWGYRYRAHSVYYSSYNNSIEIKNILDYFDDNAKTIDFKMRSWSNNGMIVELEVPREFFLYDKVTDLESGLKFLEFLELKEYFEG